jgi:hypothetical protein
MSAKGYVVFYRDKLGARMWGRPWACDKSGAGAWHYCDGVALLGTFDEARALLETLVPKFPRLALSVGSVSLSDHFFMNVRDVAV